MPYATEADLASRPYAAEIEQLLDPTGTGARDAAMLTAAQGTVDGLVDAYLSGTYTTPVSPVPAVLAALACDMVRFRLWGSGVPEEVKAANDAAIAMLRDFARGVASLTSAGVVVDPVAPLGIAYTDRTRTFDDDALADFVGA